MLDEAQSLPDDIAALKAMVLTSRAELRNRDLLIEKLKHQLAGLRRQRFGATSEASTSSSSGWRMRRSRARPRRRPSRRPERNGSRSAAPCRSIWRVKRRF